MQHLASNLRGGKTFYDGIRLKPLTALQYCMRLYSETPVSAEHWYSSVNQGWKNEKHLIDDLLNNQLYHDDNIIAFNKPSGLAMKSVNFNSPSTIGQVSDPLSRFSLSSIKAALQRATNSCKLQEVFCLGKQQSGVVIYSKSDAASLRLRRYFRRVRSCQEFSSTYWAFCTGIPQPASSTETFYLTSKIIGGKPQTVVITEASRRQRQHRLAITCRTKYNVLDSKKYSQCRLSLVEIASNNTKWNSLELFLLNKLSPVLGDHLHSARLKYILDKPVLMEPKPSDDTVQRIPFELSKMLQLSERDFPAVPLHLHCTEVSLPDLSTPSSGKKLTIRASLPYYFCQTVSACGFEVQMN